MPLDAHRSLLLAIDLQEKMVTAVADHDELLRNCEWMVRVAQKIGVRVAAIEPSNSSRRRTPRYSGRSAGNF